MPSNPSTGAIWTELATITVAAFSEPIIARLRTFIANTPHFDQAHLQMLGPIAVRHVALMLAQPAAVDPAHDQTQKPPSESCSDTGKNTNITQQRKPSVQRRNFRDFAYHAVRLNKIFPETLGIEPHPNIPNNVVRKLSITSTPPQSHSHRTSAPLPHRDSAPSRRRPASQPRVHHTPFSSINQPESEQNNPIIPSPKKNSQQWRHQPGLPRSNSAFPRADVSSTLESASVREFKLRSNENTAPEQLPTFPNISSPPPLNRFPSAHQTSRLVLLRRQREKRKATVR